MRYSGILIFILLACSSEPAGVELYPDMKMKVQELVENLRDKPISLQKIGNMDGEQDTTLLSGLDSAQWNRELQLFSSANFNKSIYRDLYEQKESADQNSNLTVRTYTYTGTKKVPVVSMEIRYLDDPSNWHGVKIKYRESNRGFQAHRDLEMNFEDMRGKYRLKDYSVNGFQKILGQDTVKFSIVGTLKY